MNSLRDFEYLVAVSELKNFGEAAKQCNVSQPTLSGQIKKLEDYLGIEIFERTSRKVLLTHKGRILINQAKQIIQAHHNFKQLAQDLLDPLQDLPMLRKPQSAIQRTAQSAVQLIREYNQQSFGNARRW